MSSDFATSIKHPAVTVTVVSDYKPGEKKSWDDLRATLAALGRQDFDEPVEFILLENASDLEIMPEDVPRTIPGVRIVSSDARGSYPLKNAGVEAAVADLVAVLDADCIPDRGWLRAGVEAMRQRPDAVAISGRTTYPGRSTLERALGLLSRSYVDRGTAGPVRLLSTNNMIVRRSVFLADPLPDDAGPMAYRLLTERLLRQGGKLYFEPKMRAIHDFEGWPMERDLRRQVGWTSIRIRQLDENIPGAGTVRMLGPVSVPILYAYRMVETTGRCFRLTKYFGLNAGHIPMLLALAALVHSFEMPGMFRALAGQKVGPTVYR
jgi:GT2 family glycosyltransferase